MSTNGFLRAAFVPVKQRFPGRVSRPRLRSRDMKVLVITAAGLRPDYLGCYGCDWVDTPNIDQLAAAGVVFDNHHAVYPDSAGVSAAWRTGNYFSNHGSNAEQAKASQKDPDLLAKLAEN